MPWMITARQRLAGFPNRTPVGVEPFVLAGILALVSAFVSGLVQTLKAATAQPIYNLRYE